MTLATGSLSRDANGVPCGWNYARISTAATTLVKTGPGILHSIVFNKHVATGIVTVRDALTDTTPTIAIITTGATLLSDPPINGIYDIAFTVGLTIVTSQAEDITVSFI